MIPRVLAKSGDGGREIFNPSSLALKIQEGFDRDFGYIWVEGEISELSVPLSGHAYFCLKDGRARLKSVMWKGRRPYAGGALAEGQSVLARGRLSLYAPRGEFQLVADYLEPRGEGALKLAYDRLKARLEDEGLFEAAKKRTLPYWPEKVAVISSASGAAAADFIKTALARRPSAHITLYPVRVQGEGAAAEIAGAINDLNGWGGFDLIVITRGGGSLTDLWAFNEEAVIRAVAASRTVTVAAIGHSTDLTLTELAADVRAITPTAAAEAVFRDQRALALYLAESQTRLARAAREHLSGGLKALDHLTRRLALALAGLYENRRLRLESVSGRLLRLEEMLARRGRELEGRTMELIRCMDFILMRRGTHLAAAQGALARLGPAGKVSDGRARLNEMARRLDRAIKSRLDVEEKRLDYLAARLDSVSPQKVLSRGYALVTRPGGALLIKAASDLRPGEEVEIRLAEGRVISTIKEMV